MPKKEVKSNTAIVLFLLSALILIILISITGCWRETKVIICSPPNTIIDEECCLDANSNFVCDDKEVEELAGQASNESLGICGDGFCDNTENCTTCWKDCGACKRIVYIYVLRNFTLTELKDDLNKLTRDGIKFKKDINALNNLSNFFYFNQPVPRYFADFMGIKYKFLYDSRDIVLNHIISEYHYLNRSDALINYVNLSRWYLIHRPKSAEQADYVARITSKKATNDYPTQPTGYQKEFRYEDWEYKNYTKEDTVLYDQTVVLDNDLVESLYASITDYSVTYKYHEYYETDEPDIVLEDFKSIPERYMTYIHTITFTCSRNLAITLYEYDFDADYCTINEECIQQEIEKNRASLTSMANRMKNEICDLKYKRKIFIYN